MRLLGLLAVMVLGLGGTAAAVEPSIDAAEWDAYKAAFMTEDGRVVDNANGGISHSESQGYGLLLSYLAQDRESFATIWGFTKRELMIRDDGLAAWKWDPTASPHVTDPNNATDGDILLAYSLGLAGLGWDEQPYQTASRDLANAVGRTATMSWHGRHVLLPGAFGFRPEDLDDGPVVNLSYWIFEAFPVLAKIAPETDWLALAIDGRRLVSEAKFGESGLPSDWISLAGAAPAPAASFPPEFSYNSIRIPLYLLRGGSTEPALLDNFVAPLDGRADPGTRLVATNQVIDPLTEPGYAIIGAAVACVLGGEAIPAPLLQFQPQSYFGSTLHLLTLSFLRENAQACL
ncbi:glycosyl hydrolase family 8 [uncultured Devosia sp.]|uniref:glycosyl hydrolase family 8 n=1 Tax=uncultured Devosia sp. TaxID=211434 RepID=UPI0035CC9C86